MRAPPWRIFRIAAGLAAMAVAGLVSLSGCVSAEETPHRGGPLRDWLQGRHAGQETSERDGDGNQVFRFAYGGIVREYLVHLPRSRPSEKHLPVVLALHGGGGNMNYMARDDLYGLQSKADQAGFIAVFANGTGFLQAARMATWNAGDCCAGARDKNIDDVGFLRAVVDQVTNRFDADKTRVYAVGMSNGGMMAYRLACEAPDIFRAIMSVAGTDSTRSCNPVKPVAILHIHARNDDHVLFGGGAGPALRDGSKVTNFTPVQDMIATWTRRNGAEPQPRRILETGGAYCDLYPAKPGGASVQLCVTETGGHSWPGGNKPRGETPSHAIGANDVMWDFFSGL